MNFMPGRIRPKTIATKNHKRRKIWQPLTLMGVERGQRGNNIVSAHFFFLRVLSFFAAMVHRHEHSQANNHLWRAANGPTMSA
jgi:hypothetical protein